MISDKSKACTAVLKARRDRMLTMLYKLRERRPEEWSSAVACWCHSYKREAQYMLYHDRKVKAAKDRKSAVLPEINDRDLEVFCLEPGFVSSGAGNMVTKTDAPTGEKKSYWVEFDWAGLTFFNFQLCRLARILLKSWTLRESLLACDGCSREVTSCYFWSLDDAQFTGTLWCYLGYKSRCSCHLGKPCNHAAKGDLITWSELVRGADDVEIGTPEEAEMHESLSRLINAFRSMDERPYSVPPRIPGENSDDEGSDFAMGAEVSEEHSASVGVQTDAFNTADTLALQGITVGGEDFVDGDEGVIELRVPRMARVKLIRT